MIRLSLEYKDQIHNKINNDSYISNKYTYIKSDTKNSVKPKHN